MGERTIGSIEFKEQRLQLFVTSATKMYAGQNNEHDYLDYGYASLDGLVSLNRLSVGCGTTPRRHSGDFTGVLMLSVWANQCCHFTRILANPAVIPI